MCVEGGGWIGELTAAEGRCSFVSCPNAFNAAVLHAGEDAMTGDTDKYLRPQDLRELGDDSLPQEGYMGFSIGARSAR